MKKLIFVLIALPLCLSANEFIDSFVEIERRVNEMWTHHTNRLAQVARMKQIRAERQKARPKAKNVPPDSPLRFAKPSKSGRRVK